jgi:hypothetical protein
VEDFEAVAQRKTPALELLKLRRSGEVRDPDLWNFRRLASKDTGLRLAPGRRVWS